MKRFLKKKIRNDNDSDCERKEIIRVVQWRSIARWINSRDSQFWEFGKPIIETRSSNTGMIMLPTLRSFRTMTSEMYVSSITILPLCLGDDLSARHLISIFNPLFTQLIAQRSYFYSHSLFELIHILFELKISFSITRIFLNIDEKFTKINYNDIPLLSIFFFINHFTKIPYLAEIKGFNEN